MGKITIVHGSGAGKNDNSAWQRIERTILVEKTLRACLGLLIYIFVVESVSFVTSYMYQNCHIKRTLNHYCFNAD